MDKFSNAVFIAGGDVMQKCQECFQEYPEDALVLVGVAQEKDRLIDLKYFCPLCYSIKIRHPQVYNVHLPQYLIIKTRQ